MKFKGLLTAATAFSLVAMPTLAAAAPVATPLTQPASESVDGENALRGSGSGAFVAILAIIALGGGIYFLVKNKKDRPNSP